MTKQRHKSARRCLVVLLLFLGCGAYDKVQPLAYEQVKSLYMVCNQQNAEQLEKIAKRITDAREFEKLRPREAEWLEAIVNEARSGNWKAAAASCRRLMEAQVEY